MFSLDIKEQFYYLKVLCREFVKNAPMRSFWLHEPTCICWHRQDGAWAIVMPERKIAKLIKLMAGI